MNAINTQSKIKISIIEDSKIHSEWLKIELQDDDNIIVSTDITGGGGIASVKHNNPSLVLIDFQLEDMTGLEVSKRIKAYDSNIRVFAITAHTEISIIERIINDKNIDAIAIKGSRYFEENLLTAIHYVAQGGTYLDPSLLTILRDSNNSNGLNELTRREFEIFIQANMGKTDDKIAVDLSVELTTIKNLKSKITKKIKNYKNKGIDNVIRKLIQNTHSDSMAITE